jgi:hypothetical protein
MISSSSSSLPPQILGQWIDAINAFNKNSSSFSPDRGQMEAQAAPFIDNIVSLYSSSPPAILVPTFSTEIRVGSAEIKEYFNEIVLGSAVFDDLRGAWAFPGVSFGFREEGLTENLDMAFFVSQSDWKAESGFYTFHTIDEGSQGSAPSSTLRGEIEWDFIEGPFLDVPSRFTFVFSRTSQGWKIMTHHSSELPQ